jgi:hypothetical protein
MSAAYAKTGGIQKPQLFKQGRSRNRAAAKLARETKRRWLMMPCSMGKLKRSLQGGRTHKRAATPPLHCASARSPQRRPPDRPVPFASRNWLPVRDKALWRDPQAVLGRGPDFALSQAGDLSAFGGTRVTRYGFPSGWGSVERARTPWGRRTRDCESRAVPTQPRGSSWWTATGRGHEANRGTQASGAACRAVNARPSSIGRTRGDQRA